MSHRVKIGCGVFSVITILAIVIPLKFVKARLVEVDVEKVERADIDETVAAVPVAGQPAGMVKPDEVKVIPKVGGELVRLLVEEGDHVYAGQVIAYLDDRSLRADLDQAAATTAAARAQVAQAVTELHAVPTRVDATIEEAQASVEQARANYETAVKGAREEEIERARQAVVQAEKELEEAEAALATTERGARPEEIASAEATLAQAKAQAESAHANLKLLEAGPRAEEVAQAQASLDQAEAQLELRKAELESQQKLAEGGYVSPNMLKTAQTAYESARAERQVAAERLALAKQPYRPEEIAQAQAAYRQALASVERAEHDLALLRRRTTPEELATARARREAAQARLRAAKADLKLAENRTTLEELRSAQAAVQKAKSAARRAKAERVTVREQQLQVARLRADLQRCEAALQQAVERAGYTVIRAPLDGMVTRVNVKEGEYVQGGAVPLPSAEIAMLVITKTDHVWIECNIDEADIDRVKVGQEAIIFLGDGKEVKGEVYQISPSVRLVQGDVRTFAVKVAVTSDTSNLRSGMSVDVDIIVKSHKNVLSVPSFAIFEEKDGKHYVYLLKDGTAKKTQIEKGAEGIERTEITSGVKEGEQVIVSVEAKGLRDGVKVKVREKQAEEERKPTTEEENGGPRIEVQAGA
ncbi:MAG: efflux RND transporter periplasmic adaptor subunit [Candidatus Zipacnadales bacterium]